MGKKERSLEEKLVEGVTYGFSWVIPVVGVYPYLQGATGLHTFVGAILDGWDLGLTGPTIVSGAIDWKHGNKLRAIIRLLEYLFLSGTSLYEREISQALKYLHLVNKPDPGVASIIIGGGLIILYILPYAICKLVNKFRRSKKEYEKLNISIPGPSGSGSAQLVYNPHLEPYNNNSPLRYQVNNMVL